MTTVPAQPDRSHERIGLLAGWGRLPVTVALALLLPGFGSGTLDAVTLAELVMTPGWVTVATRVRVALAPLARLPTLQRPLALE